MALNLNRLGQRNNAGPDRADFQTQFLLEILAAYAMNTVYADKQIKRVINSGSGAKFPAVGNIGAEYVSPGTELAGLNAPMALVDIPIDGTLTSSIAIADLDEAMLSYDVRGHFSRKMGEALAEQYDKNIARNAIKAARAANVLTGYNGGSIINGAANIETDPDLIVKAFFTAAQLFDEKNIPQNNRYAFVRPKTYYALAQSPNLINKDWDGDGSLSKGVIGRLAGFEIIPTNNIPDTDETATATVHPNHRADYSKTAFHFMNDTAVGTVQLKEMAMEKSRETRYLSDFMVASMAVGHGVLRPDAAIEVVKP